jgi:hypothetical protein
MRCRCLLLALLISPIGAQFIPEKRVAIHPATLSKAHTEGTFKGPGNGLGKAPPAPAIPRQARSAAVPAIPPQPPAPQVALEGAAVEQTSAGTRAPLAILESFDGLGYEPDRAGSRGGIDLSLAIGPDHIFEIVDGNLAIYSKKGRKFAQTGKLLYGPVPNRTIFAGFGNRCNANNNADSVVRFDQFANRWLVVVPVFAKGTDPNVAPYAMCYAVSATPDPLGQYYRYEFERPLFPDYPRPAIWPDGYYNPTSTSDNYLPDVITQKHVCIVDRKQMLKGLPATEQCVVIDGAVFLLNADADGRRPPPPGAPNIMMSTGGSQLMNVFEDDGIYFYEVHVDWRDPAKTSISEPRKIPVAPYHYLCNGQLSSCVPQPGTERRLDSQGDKLIQRLVYRNLGDHQSILATHSVATAARSGGVRWYEFRLNPEHRPVLFQQGTYAPEGAYRWLGSLAMDHKGDIAMGYSFGDAAHYPGQRVTARTPADTLGQFSFRESPLADGQASQVTSLRWEDYTNIAIDPADDCTFWFTGNYLQKDAPSSTSRIGSFRVPGCRKD